MAQAHAERRFVRRASTVRYLFVSTTLWLPSSLLSLIPLAPPVTPFLFSPLLEARTAPRDSTPPLGTALCRFSIGATALHKKTGSFCHRAQHSLSSKSSPNALQAERQ